MKGMSHNLSINYIIIPASSILGFSVLDGTGPLPPSSDPTFDERQGTWT